MDVEGQFPAFGTFPAQPVMVVDDEERAIQGCDFMLRTAGIDNILHCNDSRDVMRTIGESNPSVVLLDLAMPHISGETLLREIVEHHPHLPVIVVTGMNEVDSAVECMKAGAFDYMVKPVEQNRMVSGAQRAIELWEVRQEYSSFKKRVLSNELEHPEAFSEIVTQNRTMRTIFQYAETIAKTTRHVLITGETGTGKELMAKAIHVLSGCKGPFVAVNVAGLDDNVFADTLFGHAKGAFTGADTARGGLIESGRGGTVFLDEIGDLAFSSQVKLLRLLQEHEYFPLGADIAKKSGARVLFATHHDINDLRESGRLRADLYYRLQGHHIHIPPLRERLDDLPVLLNHLLQKAADSLEKAKPTAPKELLILLGSYPFPGNVRELESLVFEAVSRHESKMLSMHAFKRHIGANRTDAGKPAAQEGGGASPFELFEELPTLKRAQRLLIAEALRRAEGNQTIAAQFLGISQSGLSKALKRAADSGDLDS